MLFNSTPFLLFFALFFVVYWFACRTTGQRLVMITLGSLWFYGSFNPWYCALLITSVLLNFYSVAALQRCPKDAVQRKKRIVTAAIVANLLLLIGFKYTDVLLRPLEWALASVGSSVTIPKISIPMPVGISFYTFQGMCYVLDVYRGTFRERYDLRAFMAADTLFPHLLTGPIVRPKQLLPQFKNVTLPSQELMRQGLLLVLVGLIKKTTADLFSPAVEELFSSTQPHSVLETWIGGMAFMGQLYGDLSGYSDMAIGLAQLIGFQIPTNFNLPYLATSPVEFWKRWHISFSTWIRDYIFIPLGLSHVYRSLLITWLIGGVWHGPEWKYAVWGVYFGVILSATSFLGKHLPQSKKLQEEFLSVRVLKIAFTLYIWLVSLMLFRANDVLHGWTLIKAMHSVGVSRVSSFEAGSLSTLGWVIAGIVFCHGLDYLVIHKKSLLLRPRVLYGVTVFGVIFALFLGVTDVPFIYFQF